MNRSRVAMAVSSILSTAVALGSGPAAAQEKSALEEIVVTASKRTERLLDVPAAVNVLGSDMIENLGLVGFDDYMGLVPGLSVRSAGAPGYGTVIIRGLNSGPQQTTSTSGFYLDDVPFTASGSLSLGSFVIPDVDLADIQSVEVLKGPQGTLYGASSLGGLVRIQTKRPDLSGFSGSASLTGTTIDDGSDGYGVRASVNLPLMQDRLALRLSGFHRQDPGFTTNVGTGSRDVNEATVSGGRLALLTQFNDDVDLLLTAFYQDTEADGFAFQDNRTDTLTPLYGQREHSSYFDPTYDATLEAYAATLNWKLTSGTLTATLAQNKYETIATADYTDNYGPLFGLPAVWGIKADPGPESDKLSVEVRYASARMGRIEFLAGVFYTDEDNLYPISLYGEDKATGQRLPLPFGNIVTSVTDSTYEETAIFGNLTWYFTDSVDLTVGARYAENEQDADITRSGLLSGSFVPKTDSFTFDDDATTYLATLRWRVSDTFSTFLRAASGYRPGGPQTNINIPDPQPYSSDTVWNYEAGLKASLLDNRLSLSASIYQIDWEDMQLNSLNGGFLLTGNAGEGQVQGLELELAYRPLDGLDLGLSLGYTDTEVTDIDPAVSAYLGAVEGDPLPLTPEYSAAATVDYRMPLSSGLSAAFGGTVMYQGEKPSSFSAAVLNPNIDIPSYTTMDLRAALDWGRYRLQLRAENVTNEEGITSAATNKVVPGQLVPTQATLIRPRSYVVSLSVDF
jgi:iron complex outermembrane recepter protein